MAKIRQDKFKTYIVISKDETAVIADKSGAIHTLSGQSVMKFVSKGTEDGFSDELFKNAPEHVIRGATLILSTLDMAKGIGMDKMIINGDKQNFETKF